MSKTYTFASSNPKFPLSLSAASSPFVPIPIVWRKRNLSAKTITSQNTIFGDSSILQEWLSSFGHFFGFRVWERVDGGDACSRRDYVKKERNERTDNNKTEQSAILIKTNEIVCQRREPGKQDDEGSNEEVVVTKYKNKKIRKETARNVIIRHNCLFKCVFMSDSSEYNGNAYTISCFFRFFFRPHSAFAERGRVRQCHGIQVRFVMQEEGQKGGEGIE